MAHKTKAALAKSGGNGAANHKNGAAALAPAPVSCFYSHTPVGLVADVNPQGNVRGV